MRDGNIIISKFGFHYIHFWTDNLEKGMNLLIVPVMGQIVSLLFFDKGGSGIK